MAKNVINPNDVMSSVPTRRPARNSTNAHIYIYIYCIYILVGGFNPPEKY